MMKRCCKNLALIAVASVATPALSAAPDLTTLQKCKEFAENTASCKLEIDRKQQVSELPVRVRVLPGEAGADGRVVAIVVRRAPMESVKFDETRTEVAEPDVLGTILQKLMDPLKGLTFDKSRPVAGPGSGKTLSVPPALIQQTPSGLEGAGPVSTWGDVRVRLRQISLRQESAYGLLKSWRDTTKNLAGSIEVLGKKSWSEWGLADSGWTEAQNKDELTRLVRHIGTGQITDSRTRVADLPRPPTCGTAANPDLTLRGNPAELGYCQFPVAELQILDESLKRVRDTWLGEPYSTDDEYRRVSQEVAEATADQAFLTAQFATATSAQEELRVLGKALKSTLENPDALKHEAVGRVISPRGSATSSTRITATNQLTKASVSLPSAAINWQSKQLWEVSLGIWISALEKRSYSNVPVIVNGQQETVEGVAQNEVGESTSRPTVVPGVIVHIRGRESERWGRRTALLSSVGIGVNNDAAEFVFGPTWAWGSIMVSLLAHVGKETRLGDGIVVGQRNAPDLDGATDRKWVIRPALGLSYRISIP